MNWEEKVFILKLSKKNLQIDNSQGLELKNLAI